MLAVIIGLIAAAIYGKIGIKVVYNNVLMEFFTAPSLVIQHGKILCALIVPLYWSIAFAIVEGEGFDHATGKGFDRIEV